MLSKITHEYFNIHALKLLRNIQALSATLVLPFGKVKLYPYRIMIDNQCGNAKKIAKFYPLIRDLTLYSLALAGRQKL